MKLDYKIFLLLFGLILSGCGMVNEKADTPFDPSTEKSDEGYKLSILIAADRVYTRAAGHEFDDGTQAEKFINFSKNDCQVYVLDGGTGTILERFNPSSIYLTERGYELWGRIIPQSESIQLLVMANWTSEFTKDYPDLSTIENLTLTQIYSNDVDYNFTYPAQTTDNPQEVMTWEPQDKVSGIPMVGLSPRVILPPKDKGYNNFVPEIDCGTIQMLRSLAKIMVINATEDENLEIKSVKLESYIKNGKFFPNGHVEENKNWFIESQQVYSISYPSDYVKQGLPLVFNKEEDEEVFYAYLPEMKPEDINPQVNCIEVVTQFKGKKEVKHQIHLGHYLETGEYEEGTTMDILRNHRYRFYITAVNDNSLQLILRVNDNWEDIHSMDIEDI